MKLVKTSAIAVAISAPLAGPVSGARRLARLRRSADWRERHQTQMQQGGAPGTRMRRTRPPCVRVATGRKTGATAKTGAKGTVGSRHRSPQGRRAARQPRRHR